MAVGPAAWRKRRGEHSERGSFRAVDGRRRVSINTKGGRSLKGAQLGQRLAPPKGKAAAKSPAAAYIRAQRRGGEPRRAGAGKRGRTEAVGGVGHEQARLTDGTVAHDHTLCRFVSAGCPRGRVSGPAVGVGGIAKRSDATHLDMLLLGHFSLNRLLLGVFRYSLLETRRGNGHWFGGLSRPL